MATYAQAEAAQKKLLAQFPRFTSTIDRRLIGLDDFGLRIDNVRPSDDILKIPYALDGVSINFTPPVITKENDKTRGATEKASLLLAALIATEVAAFLWGSHVRPENRVSNAGFTEVLVLLLWLRGLWYAMDTPRLSWSRILLGILLVFTILPALLVFTAFF
jgi:hypothetical protein